MRSRIRSSLAAAASLGVLLPAALSAQVRPEVGLSVGLDAGLGGEPLDDLETEALVGLEGGVKLAGTWRLALEHRPNALALDLTTSTGTDLATTTLEVRRTLGPTAGLRPYASLRIGQASVDYAVAFLASAPYPPGAETRSEDAGLLLAPTAGVRFPLGRHAALDLDSSVSFMDLDPPVVQAGREPGWSSAFRLSVGLVARP